LKTVSGQSAVSIIRARIRKARKAKGLTQSQLADSRFTKAYISSLERGTTRPSLKALEHIASRLELPLSYFVNGVEMGTDPNDEAGLLGAPDLEALKEDLNYQYNYARMLIRNADPASMSEALSILAEAEQSAAPYARVLPEKLLYRSHFLRGQLYMRRSEFHLALPEMELALAKAGSDEESVISVRNILGIGYYLQQQPSTALHHHLLCLYAIDKGVIKDLSLKLSILHNIANDYWALHDVTNAIDTYKRALPLVDDVNGLDRQASLLWALGMAYKAAQDWPQAKLYATRALNIYESLDNMSGAASVCLHLAELFIAEDRFSDAENLLSKAEGMLHKINNRLLLSTVHTDYAEMFRKKGDLSQASSHIERSLGLIDEITGHDSHTGDSSGAIGKLVPASTSTHTPASGSNSGSAYTPINLTRAHVEALHVAAVVAEGQGKSDEADRFFAYAQHLVKQTDLVELAHIIAVAYAEVLEGRGDFQKANEQYRIAVQKAPTHSKPHSK
jgi:transcriptional regulator with XRE-family HTH domain